MRYLLLTIALSLLIAGSASGQHPGFCDCYGGFLADGTWWYLQDHSGADLQDGDWVYAAWAGEDGEIDPPDKLGYPTGDDFLVFQNDNNIEYGGFFITVTTWPPGDTNRPLTGDMVYCRIFDGPPGSIGPGNYYGDSQLFEIQYIAPPEGQDFFCLFPGDPGGGHTDTPVPTGTAAPTGSDNAMPAGFILYQNYPNPFNPATEIRYSIPEDAQVTLKVYNIRGAQVAALVDDHQGPGEYSVHWNAVDLTSGVYLCVLDAGQRKAVRKMILLR
jgi:hypothetical protein